MGRNVAVPALYTELARPKIDLSTASYFRGPGVGTSRASAEGETPHVALTNCILPQPKPERNQFPRNCLHACIAVCFLALSRYDVNNLPDINHKKVPFWFITQ